MSASGAPDSLGLWAAASALPEELPGLFDAARGVLGAAGWRVEAGDVRMVAAAGLGTDGVAAHAAAALCAPHLAVPFCVIHDSPVPRAVDDRAVFFALSCDGEAEEIVRAASEAAARGARVIAVGGRSDSALARQADRSGFAWHPLGARGPRTLGALAGQTFTVLAALAGAGLVPDPTLSVGAAAATLARRRDQFLTADGPAVELARRLGRTIPLVYGAEGVGEVAARWWKARVNLNAKSPAFFGAIPPAGYDEVSGWGQGGDVTRQVMSLVLLRHAGEPPAAASLFAGVRQATDEVMADVLEVQAVGEDDLARLFDLALLGELVSLHLARREGVDPGPVPAVESAHRAPAEAP